MPRTLPAALLDLIRSESFHLATLVKIVRSDGLVIALTTWGDPLQVDLEGSGDFRTYRPAELTGISSFSAQINGAIDDAEVSVSLDSVKFIADDIRRGFFNQASVTIGYTNPTDLANAYLHRKYELGMVRIEGVTVKLELLGPEKRLENVIGRPLTLNCPWKFGDEDCGVDLDVPTWLPNTVYAVDDEVKPINTNSKIWARCITAGTSGGTEPPWPPASANVFDGTVEWMTMHARVVIGTVINPQDDRSFDAENVDIAVDYFGEGEILWLSGLNAGERHRIRRDNGEGTIVQHLPPLDAILFGDVFQITAGCRKRIEEDCFIKWDNSARFGGFPFLAPEDVTAVAPHQSEEEAEEGSGET